MTKIKGVRTKDLFENMCTVVVTPDGNTYKYFPYWIKVLGEDYFEVLSFDKLPQELKDEINERYKDTYE